MGIISVDRRARSKAMDLGSIPAGVRRFESCSTHSDLEVYHPSFLDSSRSDIYRWSSSVRIPSLALFNLYTKIYLITDYALFMELDNYPLAISLILNLLLGLFFIGNIIKAPKPKKIKNIGAAKIIASIIIGVLFGLLVNILVTSMFEMIKQYPTQISPYLWPITFVISFSGTMFLLWKLILIYSDAMGE
jgi:hypothetical protein